MYLDMACLHNKALLFLSMLYCNKDILSPLFPHGSIQPQTCISFVFIHRVQMLWQHKYFRLHYEVWTSFQLHVCVDSYRVIRKSWASLWIQKTTQNTYKRKQQNLSIIQPLILPFLTYFLRLAYMLWWNTGPLLSQGNHCTCIHQAVPKLVTYCEHQATICLMCNGVLVTDSST